MLHLFGDFQDEADAALQATYAPRDPIAQYLRGRITTRRLRVLFEGLPPDSAFHRAQRENDWTDLEWMTRDTNYRTQRLLWYVESFLTESKPDRPEPLPSPLDGQTGQDEVDKELALHERAQMDVAAARLFANN